MNEIFTPEEKQALLEDLVKWATESDHWAQFNQAWNVGFKVALLLLAVASAVSAAAISLRYKKKPAPLSLSIFNASASTVLALLSAFAFTQIDYAGRQRTYETKRNEYRVLIDELKYSTPTKGYVFGQLRTIHSCCDTYLAPAGGLAKKEPH